MARSCHANMKWITCLLIVLSINANHVFAIEIRNGDLEGSIDTTLSYGHLYRVQSRATNLTGIANGGSARSVNGDDGNLNYNSGLVSSTAKFTTELDLSYKSSGIFVRAFGFNDAQTDDTLRTTLTPQATRLVEKNVVLRDAYFWHEFDIGNMPGEFRIGEQVLSWGESTFIQNSINTINPIDVSAIRSPGAELREALVPVGMLYGSLGVTENVSLEAYYQYDWEQTVIDPAGSYFSTNDFAGDGGTFLLAAGGGTIADYVGCPTACTPATVFAAGASATRAGNIEPGNGGEYGAAMRLYVPELNDTELGFYYINYHSRLPIINGVVSTAGAGIAGSQYQLSYPDDINLFGFSFNTQLGNSGVALQGEYSFRNDVPLQLDDVEILTKTINVGAIASQLGPTGTLAAGTFVQGHIERNVSQFQMTASKVFGQVLKADQLILLSEWAITHIHNMPSKSTLLLEGPGTYTTGNSANLPFLAGHVLEEADNFADSTSWGYRIAGRLEYNNVLFGSVNLQPRFAWQHDVSGITPGPGGNFIAGRKILSLGVRAVYQNQWEADLSYTSYLGDNRQHLLHDRDFTAFSIKYSF